MLKLLMLMASAILCIGCSSMPVKSATPMAQYSTLIVRDINWKETAISELAGEQLKDFVAAQPRLNELFRSEFDKYMKDMGFFETITYGNAPAGPDALILLPKIYTLKPGGFMPGASYVGLLMSGDGRLIAKYGEERRLNSSGSAPEKAVGNIEKLIRELAEDAASRLPYAR